MEAERAFSAAGIFATDLSPVHTDKIVEAAMPVNPYENLTGGTFRATSVRRQATGGGRTEREIRAICGFRRHITGQMYMGPKSL